MTTVISITAIAFAFLWWSIADDINKHTENDKHDRT